MPGQAHDVSTSTSPSPRNAKRAPIRIQPTGYRRPSSQSNAAHSSSNPASPTPKSPQTRSPTPRSPTSYNYTPRTPASPGPAGSASPPPAQRPKPSSRAKSAPSVAKVREPGGAGGGKESASALAAAAGTGPTQTSRQPRVKEDAACAGAEEEEDYESSDEEEEEEDGQGSEDETNTRPATATPTEPPRKSSLANLPATFSDDFMTSMARLKTGHRSQRGQDAQIQGFSTPPTSPRQPRSPRSPPTTSPTKPGQSSPMQEINIGVLGTAHVGKSTFMQGVLDLKTPPTPNAPMSARKMSLDGRVYVVRLFELGFDQVEFGGNEEDENIVWPEKLGDLVMPKVDGTLVLYDVTNQKSLAENKPAIQGTQARKRKLTPNAIDAMSKASIPCVLVACKCDSPLAQKQVDPTKVEQRARTFIKDVAAAQTARTSPSTQKQCISIILKTILSKSASGHELGSTRRRAVSNAVRGVSPRPPDRSGHSRATSEHSGRVLMAKNKENEHTPVEGSSPQKTEPSKDRGSPIAPGLSNEMTRVLPPQPVAQGAPAEQESYTFDQLVDKLLAQTHFKTDAKFSFTFLLMYRKFAAPGTLLEAIISRFVTMQNSDEPEFTKTTAQLRYLAVIESWVAQTPEDFLHPWTRQLLLQFTRKVGRDRIYTMAAKEIQARLESPINDDHSEAWPFSDADRPVPDTMDLSSAPVASDASGTSSNSDKKKHQHSLSTSTLTPTSSATSATSNNSNPKLSPTARARELAHTFMPTSRNPLSKVQWHALMAQSDDSIAKELTRINWTLLSSIHMRDTLRHMSLSPSQQKALTACLAAGTDKEPDKLGSLVLLERQVAHFNFLAAWTANLVLLRDKPKHRALMLEKLMRVARKLRELNDYCALGALLAGLGSAAVARLVATRDLVPEPVRKDFLKLEILMSSQKSYAAYRLAWENSPDEKIPFLPLVRRDMVGAEAGSRTFLDGSAKGEAFGPGKAGRVNWRKFEILGDLVVGLQKAQSVPFPRLPKNDEVRSLILDTKICQDDEELYVRSCQVEPTPQAGDRNFLQRIRRR
ncbi:MAG: hypothetical protein M1822_008607 [Bathelium mastoideum]|nr:MAG: hypothetical protein M1822_008607 [Bathelium mastoideum]